MRFLLDMACNNAAFAPFEGEEESTRNAEHEVARILRGVADMVEEGRHPVRMMDANGAGVGLAEFVEGDQEVSAKVAGTPFIGRSHPLVTPCYAIHPSGAMQCGRDSHTDEWHFAEAGGEVTAAWRDA